MSRSWKLDSQSSTLTVLTYAEGLLSRLAHDLVLEARAPSGLAGSGSGEPGQAEAEVRLDVASLVVVGVQKHGRVDRSVLSKHDVEDIELRMRAEALAGTPTLVAKAEARGDTTHVTVTRGSHRASLTTKVHVEPLGEDAVAASGRCTVSLQALGVAPVKGPLGAFRMKDGVDVTFRFVFRSPA